MIQQLSLSSVLSIARAAVYSWKLKRCVLRLPWSFLRCSLSLTLQSCLSRTSQMLGIKSKLYVLMGKKCAELEGMRFNFHPRYGLFQYWSQLLLFYQLIDKNRGKDEFHSGEKLNDEWLQPQSSVRMHDVSQSCSCWELCFDPLFLQSNDSTVIY